MPTETVETQKVPTVVARAAAVTAAHHVAQLETIDDAIRFFKVAFAALHPDDKQTVLTSLLETI